ncbi:hypothetical protein [Halobellus ruber]|uniref:Domain of unknown function domain-containing protein n=1 Tax=Halobellus ruber TaxID=2761102 RepID=A0A7J9SN00_9EURY|nr:hypothetical protein [Halobellus ruber]MBB6647982.1 hypothetical protein [Halobellus ruber]
MTSREARCDRVGSADPGTVPEDSCPPEIREQHLDRERGILTRKDRELLMDEPEDTNTNAQAVRNRRYQIRKRVKNSIKDFDILSRCWEKRDRELVFESLVNNKRGYLKEVGIFLYLGFQDLGAGKKRFLKEVIEEAEHRRGNAVDVTVSAEFGERLSYHIDVDENASTPPADAD